MFLCHCTSKHCWGVGWQLVDVVVYVYLELPCAPCWDGPPLYMLDTLPASFMLYDIVASVLTLVRVGWTACACFIGCASLPFGLPSVTFITLCKLSRATWHVQVTLKASTLSKPSLIGCGTNCVWVGLCRSPVIAWSSTCNSPFGCCREAVELLSRWILCKLACTTSTGGVTARRVAIFMHVLAIRPVLLHHLRYMNIQNWRPTRDHAIVDEGVRVSWCEHSKRFLDIVQLLSRRWPWCVILAVSLLQHCYEFILESTSFTFQKFCTVVQLCIRNKWSILCESPSKTQFLLFVR